MDELRSLKTLARAMGVHTHYTDGLHRHVTVAPETLLRVCAALGAPVSRPADASDAMRAIRAIKKTELLPPTLVAWHGTLVLPAAHEGNTIHAEIRLEDGEVRSCPIAEWSPT